MDFDINDNDWEILDKLITNSKLENIKEEVKEDKMNFNKMLKNKKKNFSNKCINCNSLNLVINEKNGYSVCQDCGVINKEIIDKNYDKMNSSKKDTSGMVNGSNNNGILISNGNYRLKMSQMWNYASYKETMLKTVLSQIDSYCNLNNIPKNISDNAKILYKNISETKYLDGKNKGKHIIFRAINRKSVIAACIFIGSKLSGNPRTLKEIAEIFKLDPTVITNGCKNFFKYIRNSNVTYMINPTQPIDFIKRYYDEIKNISEDNNEKELQETLYKLHKEINIKLSKLNDDDFDKIKNILDNINSLDLASDHQSISIASSTLYLYSILNKKNISKKRLSQIFKISEVTITKTFRKIYPFKNIILDNEITNILLQKIVNDEDILDMKKYICNDEISKNKEKGRPKKIII